MFESKRTPGKKFGSAFVGKRYDAAGEAAEPAEEKMKKKAPQLKEDIKPVHEEVEGQEQNENEGQDAASVVAEHGPAHTIITTHDHEGKKHHTTSHHKDGHKHESDHNTAKEAHEEGGALAGADEKQQNPDEAQQSAASENDGFEMPDLA